MGQYVPYCSAVVQRMTLYIPSVFATEFTAPKASGMLGKPSPAEAAEAAATATAATFWRSRTRSWGSTAHRCCTSQHISDGKKNNWLSDFPAKKLFRSGSPWWRSSWRRASAWTRRTACAGPATTTYAGDAKTGQGKREIDGRDFSHARFHQPLNKKLSLGLRPKPARAQSRQFRFTYFRPRGDRDDEGKGGGGGDKHRTEQKSPIDLNAAAK